VSILLHALESAGKDVDYYALDLSLKELKRTLEQVPKFKHVKCHGLHGTYDDGLDWLKLPENKDRPKCVMSLGSSIGGWRLFPNLCMQSDKKQAISPMLRPLVSLLDFPRLCSQAILCSLGLMQRSMTQQRFSEFSYLVKLDSTD